MRVTVSASKSPGRFQRVVFSWIATLGFLFLDILSRPLSSRFVPLMHASHRYFQHSRGRSERGAGETYRGKRGQSGDGGRLETGPHFSKYCFRSGALFPVTETSLAMNGRRAFFAEIPSRKSRRLCHPAKGGC